jgi:hypothetical protein
VGDPGHPEQLQSAIETAVAQGEREIRITPGVYHMPHNSDFASLALHSMSDVSIDAEGVEIVIHDVSKVGVGFYDCSNVSFSGATIHYYAPQTSQGVIEDFGENAKGKYYDILIDQGFPQNADFRLSTVMDTESGEFKSGTYDLCSTKVESLDEPRMVRVYWNSAPRSDNFRTTSDGQPEDGWNVKRGDSIACRATGVTSLVHIRNSRNCTFTGLNIYWGGIFGLFESQGGGNKYSSCTISYGPVPEGATRRALLSQSADAFHSQQANPGPFVEYCLFEGMPDDGIAMHGYYEWVGGQDGRDLLVGVRQGDRARMDGTQFTEGSKIRIQNNATGFIDEAVVINVKPETDYTSTIEPSVARLRVPLRFYRITIDRDITVPLDSLVTNPEFCSSGYKIIGCTIQNNRARGMLLTADDGLIQGNVIDGSTMAGIVIQGESGWVQAGYSRNIRIVGNTISNTGRAHTGPHYEMAAAIYIGGEGSVGNANIEIRDNKLINHNNANIAIRWTDGAVIEHNSFINSHQCESPVGPVGEAHGIDSNSLIWVGDSSNVVIGDNYFENISNQAQYVSVSKTAKGVLVEDN